MSEQKYDVIVIGTGPGGEGAAMKSAKGGKLVAVVEKYGRVGGGCTHWGTIPSKALRHAINRMMEFNRNPAFRSLGRVARFSYPDLLRTAESVIAQQTAMRRDFYDRNGIPVYRGTAAFIDAHTLEVRGTGQDPVRLRADHFVLATGSRPYRPADVDFNHPRVFDSDTILSMAYTPESITIYGAGVIGCEYASMFRNMGCKVNLVNTRDQLLSFLDDEITHALNYHLRDQGVVIRHNETYERVESASDGVVVHFKSGKRIKSDILLWANGRTGNAQGIGLEDLGIRPNGRGQIDVNANYQTALPHIYAVGDVIGYPSLASASYDQGRFAATHLVEGRCESRLVEYVPTGIYTSPEISSVGRTERELTDACVPYEVGYSWFKNLARAQITGKTVGMLKLLFHRDTLELLGIHCFGDQAAEIVHIGQAIMSQQGEANSLLYFVNTTFNYPTMAEAYRVAALNGLNRAR
ncbi:Si-specific NAD(P)(+) transhydrogenase [Plasticicumulans acidivorans]|uniref:Soluble pyridine nucleotide transhydrogenase n=1 Tax=Plasticicumulans acidivorans TaxID=886464 RepID=A0A317MQB6_9GAMM|nr:Si-specific NAD(P)(+) transhydrogenase [Plasticicumulans acidivorans]PWV58833.1 pyruvate/2-oxoglutarate dehydrogenase complex dihydrolipoamide dehydrogenase (E3) component [Plasticicumulans acidivorans]